VILGWIYNVAFVESLNNYFRKRTKSYSYLFKYDKHNVTINSSVWLFISSGPMFKATLTTFPRDETYWFE